MHDCTIEAYSDGLGRGAEFVVCLPVLMESPAPVALVGIKQTASVPRRILLVDDNLDSANSLAMVLQMATKHVVGYDSNKETSACYWSP